jgi:hypothetical protein
MEIQEREGLESASRPDIAPRQRLSKLGRGLKWMAAAGLVICAYWNVISGYQIGDHLPPRETEELVVKEQALAPVRDILLLKKYKGEIAFVTNRSLSGSPPNPEDDKRWGQSQYVMIPWVLLRDRRNTPFVIADFWDGPPAGPLEGLVKLYEDGHGLTLFRAKETP